MGSKESEPKERGVLDQPFAPGTEATPSLSKTLLIKSEARAADEMRLDMIADIVHDLRTQLVCMRGYSRMMLEERAGPLNSTQKEYLSTVIKNMNQMVGLLSELAHVATAERLALEPLDVRDLWQESLRLWKPRAVAKSVGIREEIPCESLPIQGDRQKLKQAFEELLNHVVESAEPGGEIVVELSGGQGKEVQVRISEARGGTLQGTSQNISTHPTPPVSLGTGQQDRDVGLSVANSIIRLHGGRVSVGRKTLGGKALTFTLPA